MCLPSNSSGFARDFERCGFDDSSRGTNQHSIILFLSKILLKTIMYTCEFRNKQQLAYANYIHFFEFFHKEILLISRYEIYVFFRFSHSRFENCFFFLFVSCKLRGKISNSFGSNSDENSENLLFLSFLSYY